MICSIFSSKGGVGKTTISVNLSYSISQKGIKVLLIDTDPQNSVGATLCIGYEKGFIDMLTNPEVFTNSMVVMVRDNMYALPAGMPYISPDKLEEIFTADNVSGVLDKLIKSLDIDMIIFDTPPGYNFQAKVLTRMSDMNIAVFEPDPVSFASFKVFEDYMFKETQIDNLYIVLNKIRPTDISEDFSFLFRYESKGSIIAFIPYDEDVSLASANCKFVKEFNKDSPFAIMIDRLADEVIYILQNKV